MSVNENAIISLEYFKEVMSISGTSNDTVYERLINAVSTYVDNYTKRNIIYSTHTNQLVNGSGTSILNLKNFPVYTVSKIERRSGFGSEFDWETIDSSTYMIDYQSGQVIKSSPFVQGTSNYRVTYTAGYSDSVEGISTVPDDLKLIVAEIVNTSFKDRRRNKSVSSERLKNFSVNYIEKEMSDDIRMVLDSYRNWKL